MFLKPMSAAALIAAMVVANYPTLVFAPASATGVECGWATDASGKMVFSGTCPHESSQDDNAPEENPCRHHLPAQLPTEMPAYKPLLAGC